jgi:tRNA(Ile)-lysidine synthase
LEAIHINHQLRGQDSDDEAEFCKNVCHAYDIPFHLSTKDAMAISKEKKISLEEAGRLIRYDIFEKYLDGHTKIALGHHMNDRVETVLLNMFRGTGTKGLCGILPIRNTYIRPLIACEKKEILAYCNEHNVEFCTDLSNFSTDYTRNKLRLECIPYIESHFNEQLIGGINQTAIIMEEDQNYLMEQAKKAYTAVCIRIQDEQNVILDRKKIMGLPISIRKRIYELALEVIVQPFKDITYTHYRQIDELLLNQSGKYIMLPHGRCVRIAFDQVIFEKEHTIETISSYELQLGVTQRLGSFHTDVTSQIIEVVPDMDTLVFSEAMANDNPMVGYFDYDKLSGPLIIRSKMNGDSIYLSGIGGHKKLKKWFLEKKIPQHQRGDIPLLIHDDEVVWVFMYLKNDLYQVDHFTKRILKIKMEHI